MTKKDEKKALRYLQLLQTLANSKDHTISEERFCKILGNPSKATKYRYIDELTKDSGDFTALVERNNDTSITLKSNHWKSYIREMEKGPFLLECFKSASMLIQSGFSDVDVEQIQDILGTGKKQSHLSRKFIYLSKVQSKELSIENKSNLTAITNALMDHKKILISYTGSDGSQKAYSVSPLSLCQHRDDLYIIGARGKGKDLDLRTFKLLRITKIEELTDTFKYPPLSQYNPDKIYKFTSGLVPGEKLEAIYRVYGFAKQIFTEKNFFNSKLVTRTTDYDEYRCYYTNPNEFLGQIFTYAQEVEIISPQVLTDQFIKKAEQAIIRNKK